MNPASINVDNFTTTHKRHTHTCRHRHAAHTQPPATAQPIPSAGTDLTDMNEKSTLKEWLYGFACAIAIPVWYGFKTGAGTHLATWLFTRFGILSTQTRAAVQHSVQYQYYIDGHATTASKYSIATPAVLNHTQPSTHAAVHHLQYPVHKPLVIPLHATH